MNFRQQLDYLFNPSSVAVIGASNVFGKMGLIRYSEYLGVARGK